MQTREHWVLRWCAALHPALLSVMASTEWFAELVQYLRDHEAPLRVLGRPSLKRVWRQG